ncbi:MAG: folate-binding protein [Pseudomonadota bacterium]|nr:folate-binding protein [Pseudomonadota bacterium]
MVANNGPRIARLGNRGLVRVEGPDWRPFLHNLLTHDLEGLEPGRLRFAALLTPQGKFLHDMFVLAEENAGVLDVQLGHREALIKRLELYKLRAKVSIKAVDGAVFAAWNGAPGPGWVADPRLIELGWRRLGGAVEAEAAEDDYDAHRMALGAPDPARDCTPDKTYPIEADFDLLNGIDFRKGCFIGQETTSRMHRRGTVKTRMLPIVFEGAPPQQGAEVLAGELRAGEVLSGRQGRAMALLRLDRIAGAALTVEGRPVRAQPPAWLAAAW